MDNNIFFPSEGVFSPSHIERSKGLKVCALDLDDVLADSIPSWIGFVNIYAKDILKDECKWQNPEFDNLWTMKKTIPYYYYRLLKEMYRNSEVKKHLPLKPYAKEFCIYLKEYNYYTVIITKREERFSKISSDWLKDNEIPYDEIIFHKNKHVKILERYPDMEFMVEDNRDTANCVSKWGYCVFLVNNIYNMGTVNKKVRRINLLDELI